MLYQKQGNSPLTESQSNQPLICPNQTCQVPITNTDPDKFYKNQQLLRLIQIYDAEQAQKAAEPQPVANAEPASPGLDGLGQGTITCPRHTDKPIEYFCRTCTHTVCVKCIFDEHNGHELVQIEEMANSLKQNVLDLQKMILNASRLNDENSKLLDQTRDELARLKFQQIKNIEKGFEDLQKKLEEKKLELKNDFEKRFRAEEQKMITKMSLIATNFEEIQNIQKIFDELLQFIDNSPDAKILQKATDMTTFMHKSFADLDQITKNQISQKAEIYVHPSFRPLTLNVRKAIEIVNKFQMVPPTGPSIPAFKPTENPYQPKPTPQVAGLMSASLPPRGGTAASTLGGPNARSVTSLGQMGQLGQRKQSTGIGLRQSSQMMNRFKPSDMSNIGDGLPEAEDQQDKAINLMLQTNAGSRKNLLDSLPQSSLNEPAHLSRRSMDEMNRSER